MKYLLNVSLVALLLTSHKSSGQPTKAVTPQFSITISANKNVVPAGAVVIVKAEVTNISRRTIIGGDGGEIRWDVRLADGTPITTKQSYRDQRMRDATRLLPPTVIRIEPGETNKWVFTMSDMYDLSHPGQYIIRAQRHSTEDSIVVASSNAINVMVTADEAQPSSAPPRAWFSFEIDAYQDVVRAGSNVDVVIKTTNLTDHPISIDNSWSQYWVDVRDTHGTLMPLTAEGRRERRNFGKDGEPRVALQPGETKGTGGIYVNQLVDLTKPGEYTIQMSRTDPETNTLVRSNIIPLTVEPRFRGAGRRHTPLFSSAISTPQTTLLSGGDLKVKAELKNESPDPVYSAGECGLELEVVYEEGWTPVPKTERWLKRQEELRHQPTLRRVREQIMPGETHKCVFLVSEIFELARPGRYMIQMKRDFRGDLVKSNVLWITVIAPNAPVMLKPLRTFGLPSGWSVR